MPSSISLVIANSKELIRAGLRSILSGSPIRIVGEGTNATNTLALVKKHSPRVLLLDTALPGESDWLPLIKRIGKALPNTKVILLSAKDNPTYMARARAAGVSDFLLESVTSKELVTAIENVAEGKPPKRDGAYARVSASMADRPRSTSNDAQLTPRESQVLSHVAYGLSNDEIARSLTISVETVKEHVQNLLRKLGVRDRTQAAVWAVKSNLA